MYFNPPAIQLIDNKELLFVCLSFSLEKKKKKKRKMHKNGVSLDSFFYIRYCSGCFVFQMQEAIEQKKQFSSKSDTWV